MNRKNVTLLFAALAKQNPHPQTELIFKNPFQLLIAVILSAQATDKSVNKATLTLFRDAPTPTAILALGYEGLVRYIQSIGLFRNKAKHILATCDILIKQHKSEVPKSRALLEALPGVGRKTANVILNTAFQLPCIAVDTHVMRVSIRTGLTAKAKNPLQVEKGLLKTIPKEYLQDAHHWLVLHGRYVCIARKPKCTLCPIALVCEYQKKTIE